MEQTNYTPNELNNSESEVTNINGVKPNFDFKKYGIKKNSQCEIKKDLDENSKKLDYLKKEMENTFPIEAFPQIIKDIIISTHDCLRFPVDFIGASIFFASGLAIGNTHSLKFQNQYIAKCVLYMVNVGYPGTNKSQPIRFALDPFIELDKKSFRDYQEKLGEYGQLQQIPKNKKGQEDMSEIVKPVWNKFIVRDFTPEALSELHANNPRGICVHRDEILGWINSYDRYSKSSDQELWMTLWNLEPSSVDRKSSASIFISEPFVSVIGTIQDDVLFELGKNNRISNGFLERILFVKPNDLKRENWSKKEIEEKVKDEWRNFIHQLLQLPFLLDEYRNPKPIIMKYNENALQLLEQWHSETIRLCNEKKDILLNRIYSKLEIYVHRFALIFQLMFWAAGEGEKESVSVKAVESAIKMVTYFKRNAEEVYSIINSSNNDPLNDLSFNWINLYNSLLQLFTTNEAWQLAQSIGIKERSLFNFLGNKKLFQKDNHGRYSKLA